MIALGGRPRFGDDLRVRRAVLLLLLASSAAGLAGAPGPAGAAERPVACEGCWTPRATTRPWQIQLAGRTVTRVAAPIVELDCDEASAATVRTLRRRGHRVLGYFSAGSTESYRADADRFPAAVVGKVYDGWPQERWLDVRRLDVLLPIMRDRIATCARKGFDGVDPDNVNGHENPTGFPISAADQVTFDRAIADEAHRQGLAVVLKNTGSLVPRLVDWFDGAVVESCFQYRECGAYSPFVRRGRPVLAIEYRRAGLRSCADARRRGISLIVKRRSLSAARWTCPR